MYMLVIHSQQTHLFNFLPVCHPWSSKKETFLSLCMLFSFVMKSQHELPQTCLTEVVIPDGCVLPNSTEISLMHHEEVPNHQTLCHLSRYLHTVVISGISPIFAISLAPNALLGTATLQAKHICESVN